MHTIDIPAVIQAAAACLTFLAACVAVWATLRAPQRAAQLAERLRVENEAAQAIRQERYRLFRVLMDHRGRNISAREPVDALNMVDVAFYDEPKVRQAITRFLKYANGAEFAQHRIDAYMDLLTAMAAVLGFSDFVTRDDLNRGYWPLS